MVSVAKFQSKGTSTFMLGFLAILYPPLPPVSLGEIFLYPPPCPNKTMWDFNLFQIIIIQQIRIQQKNVTVRFNIE